MEKEYQVLKNGEMLRIVKKREKSFCIEELKEILEILIKLGKGDYQVCRDAFCCGTSSIDISNKSKEISLD